MPDSLDFAGVDFSYDTLASALITDLSVRFGRGWTGIGGANGTGKTTLLRLAAGELTPTGGMIRSVTPAMYCPQRTDVPPEDLADLLASTDGPAYRLRGSLGVEDNWLDRWDTLSHGERKRAQIAVMIRREPAVLAVDEPSNHIDAEARELLINALRSFRGIGLLVSHDRTMLDDLCDRCLFLDPPYAPVLRPGGYTKGMQQNRSDGQRAQAMHDKARREVKQVKKTMIDRRERASREHKVRSKRGLARKDHDARAKINTARLTDSKSGASLRQVQGRMKQAENRLAGVHVKNQLDMGFWVPQSRCNMDYLLRVEPCTIPMGSATSEPSACLHVPELQVRPDDRIAVTGRNGAGKSTLIHFLMEHMRLPQKRVMWMPQEISTDESVAILESVRQTPPQQLGRLMNVISRLGSQPQRLLQTEQPSPGEVRKLLLALGVVNAASFIVMDEPTNHLDLPSIRCLEDALAECPCALLLVSHDDSFLKKLTKTRWDIVRDDDSDSTLQVTDTYTTEEI